ncbi:DUF711 family protein [Alloacidobacterium dinghuense]|uniref:DUF711 family protein n=1 Tax=Alloacidobacterium dinghuense TaxID=2763107 RepID=A0A7G8BEL1_9BACT|nr:DUF711 family protein [Alloacidobacterium dinghuense]QNI30981.1 DUF711 family protein [Alloacidobacterium dinghuense]
MKRIVFLALFLVSAYLAAQTGPNPSNPKVRAITGFVLLDRDNYQKQIADALVVLRKTKSQFESAGYEVETLRITTQPLAELVSGLPEDQALAFLKQLDDLSVKENFLPNVGPAMWHDSDDPATMHLLERALSTLPNIEASTIIADGTGIHWKTIHRTAQLVKYVSEHSPHGQGTFNFTATAMLNQFSPFFPGSYHLGNGKQFAIGFEGANVVIDVFTKDKGNYDTALADLTAALSKHASVADAIGKKVAAETGWDFLGVDPTPAPLGDVSIGAAIEAFTGAKFGSSGTLTAARIITAAVKAVPVTQVGYSGLMVPVMEDKLLAQRWAESAYNVDSLLAYSAVCGTGLDTVPLPGDVSVEQMERIFGDVASLATKWNKPLSARLQPVPGKKAGDRTEFQDPYLFNTIVHTLP